MDRVSKLLHNSYVHLGGNVSMTIMRSLMPFGYSIGILQLQAMTDTALPVQGTEYLAILQGTNARIGDLKDALLSEFLLCVKQVLKWHLPGNKKISVLKVFAIRSLAYAFAILP